MKRKIGITISLALIAAFVVAAISIAASLWAPVQQAKADLQRALIPSMIEKAKIEIDRMVALSPAITYGTMAIIISANLAGLGIALAVLGWGLSNLRRAAQPIPIALKEQPYIVGTRLVDPRDGASTDLREYSPGDLQRLNLQLTARDRRALAWQNAAVSAAAALASLASSRSSRPAETALARIEDLQGREYLVDDSEIHDDGHTTLVIGSDGHLRWLDE